MLVLFGSQTGNAQSIAQDVNEKLLSLNISSSCFSLNEVAEVPFIYDPHAVIISNHFNDIITNSARGVTLNSCTVCSTTGNGDCPDNAEKFWRIIKKRSMPKDTFQQLPFCVLALGDTNYDKFCYMGKSIDKRMTGLGGYRFLDLHCADEATGLEDVVEDWKRKVVDNVRQVISNFNCVDKIITNEENIIMEMCKPSEKVCNLQDIIPKGVALMADVCSAMDFDSQMLLTKPEDALLPKRRMGRDRDVEVLQEIPESKYHEKSRDTNKNGFSDSKTFMSNVVEAHWMTKNNVSSDCNICESTWGEDHAVIHLELDITGSGFEYQPGDYMSVLAPNPKRLVNYTIDRLNANVENVVRFDGDLFSLQEILDYK